MLTAALLTALSLAGNPGTEGANAAMRLSTQAAKQVAPPRRVADRPLRDLNGRLIGFESNAAAALGGSFSNPLNPRSSARAYLNRVFEVTLTPPNSSWEEKFLIGVPKVPLAPAPLLVAFHGFGNTHHDIAQNTKYFQRALARGWIVVAPLGAHKFNYAIDYSQDNIEAVLYWVVSHYNIDWERIYGVGFSMGGGVASAYAARHLDPEEPRFAAVLDHTGTVSVRDVWTNAVDKSLLEHPLMFGGAPAQYPFRYQQASAIDIDAQGRIDSASDLARNLVEMPCKMFAVTNDPLQHLVVQTTLYHGHLNGLGGEATLQLASGNVHSWSTLNENAALDWLSQFVLSEPLPGTPVKVLADRDDSWWGYRIEQATAGEFTPFRWTIDLANNRVTLDQFSNVSRVRFLPVQVGLQVGAQPVQVMLNLVGQTSVDIVVEGFPVLPSSVTRTGNSSPNWSYDPVTNSVTLHETNGVGYPRWTITP